jgi:sec-independent protein translocase protein TatA
MRLGPTELIIILVIVIILFGVGRIGKIAGELGSGIRSFREGLQGDKENTSGETTKEEKPSKE